MKRIGLGLPVLVFLVLANPCLGAGITATPADNGSGDISVSGVVFLKCGETVASDLKVEVWQEGSVVQSFTIPSSSIMCDGMFQGASSGLGLSSGTYSVLVSVDITGSCSTDCTAPLKLDHQKSFLMA